jgi:hypothetical protein
LKIHQLPAFFVRKLIFLLKLLLVFNNPLLRFKQSFSYPEIRITTAGILISVFVAGSLASTAGQAHIICCAKLMPLRLNQGGEGVVVDIAASQLVITGQTNPS